MEREGRLEGFPPTHHTARSLRPRFSRSVLRCVEVIASLHNRTAERRGRQHACVWQTWQGYYLRVLSWSSLNLSVSSPLQKDLFKGRWSLRQIFFKQTYCDTRFTVFFALPSCCVSSLMNGDELANSLRCKQTCHSTETSTENSI